MISRWAFGIALAASTSTSCVVALRATSRPIETITKASCGKPKVAREATTRDGGRSMPSGISVTSRRTP
jgi:hypothetical protein